MVGVPPDGLVPSPIAGRKEPMPPTPRNAARAIVPVLIFGPDFPVQLLRVLAKTFGLRSLVVHTLDGPRGPGVLGQQRIPELRQGILCSAQGPLLHDRVHFAEDILVDRADGEDDVHPLAASVHLLLEAAVVRLNVASDRVIGRVPLLHFL